MARLQIRNVHLRRAAGELEERRVELEAALRAETSKQEKLLALLDTLTPDAALTFLPYRQNKLLESRAKRAEVGLLLGKLLEKDGGGLLAPRGPLGPSFHR